MGKEKMGKAKINKELPSDEELGRGNLTMELGKRCKVRGGNRALEPEFSGKSSKNDFPKDSKSFAQANAMELEQLGRSKIEKAVKDTVKIN